MLAFWKACGKKLLNLDFRISSQAVDSEVIQDIVEYCPSLRTVNFSSGFGDGGLQAIGYGLTNLTSLSLTCCKASDETFARSVSQLNKLKTIDLQFGDWTDIALCYLPCSVTKVTLTFIDGFTDVGLTWMLKNLELKELSLDRTGVKGTDEAVNAFLECPTLTYVTLTPFITDAHLQVLVKTNINCFNLFSNIGITNEGAK